MKLNPMYFCVKQDSPQEKKVGQGLNKEKDGWSYSISIMKW